MPAEATLEQTEKLACTQILDYAKAFFKTLKTNKPFKYGSNLRRNDKMATIKVEVTYDPKKETLSQALASLLTEKPEHTEITAQMSLFDNPAPTETPTAQASTEAPQESPAESAPETPDTKPAEAKTISKADVRALAVKLSKNDKAALKAIFKELGVANLSAVKEEDYPVFYEKLVAANG